MDEEIIYRSKSEACVAAIHFLENGQRYPGTVSVETTWTRVGQDEYGWIRILSGPEVKDFFYDER